MAKAAQKDELLELPEGGIAAFVMSDEDADAIYGPDDDGTEEFGNNGIAQFPALTKKMAAMGREGDNTLAHVETGELIIPAVFLKDDPQMKETLFAFLERQGVENPERYVVGSDENSINPNTGAPEFFFKFIKKAIKGVVKGVKNVIKGVVKVVKKIAPVVLPIVLGMTPLGAVYGAALGNGIGTLISGGSLKDALKSGVMAGITGGIIKGGLGMMKGQGFLKTIGNELANPGARFADTLSGAATSFGDAGAAIMDGPGGNTLKDAFYGGGKLIDPNYGALSTPEAKQKISLADQQKLDATQLQTNVDAAAAGTYEAPSFGESIAKGDLKSALFPNANAPTAAQIQAGTNLLPGAAKIAAEGAQAGFLRSYLPMAAAGTAVAGAAGAFQVPEQEEAGVIGRDEDGNPITGSTLVEDDPSKYLIADLGNIVLNPETGQYETKSTYTPPDIQAYDATAFQMSNENPFSGGQPGFGSVSTATGPFARPSVVQAAAKGGQIFPRRTGGIMPNEGVPNKDSVRAMLMPGEFVMTTDAVKGLGNGNMQQGIQNMYSVMSKLENRGRQTA